MSTQHVRRIRARVFVLSLLLFSFRRTDFRRFRTHKGGGGGGGRRPALYRLDVSAAAAFCSRLCARVLYLHEFTHARTYTHNTHTHTHTHTPTRTPRTHIRVGGGRTHAFSISVGFVRAHDGRLRSVFATALYASPVLITMRVLSRGTKPPTTLGVSFDFCQIHHFVISLQLVNTNNINSIRIND